MLQVLKVSEFLSLILFIFWPLLSDVYIFILFIYLYFMILYIYLFHYLFIKTLICFTYTQMYQREANFSFWDSSCLWAPGELLLVFPVSCSSWQSYLIDINCLANLSDWKSTFSYSHIYCWRLSMYHYISLHLSELFIRSNFMAAKLTKYLLWTLWHQKPLRFMWSCVPRYMYVNCMYISMFLEVSNYHVRLLQ